MCLWNTQPLGCAAVQTERCCAFAGKSLLYWLFPSFFHIYTKYLLFSVAWKNILGISLWSLFFKMKHLWATPLGFCENLRQCMLRIIYPHAWTPLSRVPTPGALGWGLLLLFNFLTSSSFFCLSYNTGMLKTLLGSSIFFVSVFFP